MNCRPGDLAVIVRSTAGNEGRIVGVVRWIGRVPGWCHSDRWEIRADRPLIGTYGKEHWHAPDAYLRPIRPGDISDEEVRDLYLPKIPEAA